MVLDVSSLTVSAVLATTLMAGAHAALWLRHREPAILWIAAAGFLGTAGGLARFAPDGAAIVIANVLALGCLACVGQACRALGGRPWSPAWLFLPSAGWVAACLWPPFFGDRELRVVAASALAVLYTSWAIDEVWQDRAERLAAARWLAGLLLINALGAFGRMVVHELSRGDPVPGLAPASGIAAVTLWTLAYLLLVGVAVMAAIAERTARTLRREAHLDRLTGLGNRRHFDLALAEAQARARALSRPLALALVDVDAFKAFNDRYGHVAGDDALRVVSAVLAATVPEPAGLARIGGEEFAIVLPGATASDALDVAEAARRALRARAIPHAGSAHGRVTVSVGIALAGPEDVAEREIVERADAALYAAKSRGRDRVVVAAPELVRPGAGDERRAA